MKKTNFLKLVGLSLVLSTAASAQQVINGSLFSPSAGGARILQAQGDTPANPAIGFHSTASTVNNPQNDGGGGNGIFRPFANTMGFATASTERMRITSGGSIGIGTTNPLHKLHVDNGLIMVSGGNPSGGAMICFSDNVAPTAYPNGRWGIEYAPSVGLNFWKPWNPSTGGGGNYYMLLKDDGKIGMGIDPGSCANAFPGNYRLYVNGGILSTGLKVANFCSTNWADYVFEPSYKLKPLEEVEAYVKENKHLPNIPSANEIEKEGLDVPQILAKQMEKIEELTLYIIELKKEMKKEIDQLKEENQKLKVSGK